MQRPASPGSGESDREDEGQAFGFNLVPGWNYNPDIIKTATARFEDAQGCP